VFGVYQRFASGDASPEERASVSWTNAAVVALGLIVSALVGFVPYLVLQSIVLAVAGAAGLWLFYVQHQFDGAYWSRNADWDHAQSALAGSSFYDLPRVLQWFSGNIGHYVHHLSPRIPNYHLEACHRSHPMFQVAPRITLRTGWRSATLRLWDESSCRLVGYDVARRRRQAA
jgi:omega-6 fatty acid desaturase (delta-12 desaturase)